MIFSVAPKSKPRVAQLPRLPSRASTYRCQWRCRRGRHPNRNEYLAGTYAFLASLPHRPAGPRLLGAEMVEGREHRPESRQLMTAPPRTSGGAMGSDLYYLHFALSRKHGHHGWTITSLDGFLESHPEDRFRTSDRCANNTPPWASLSGISDKGAGGLEPGSRGVAEWRDLDIENPQPPSDCPSSNGSWTFCGKSPPR
jgi:hypothetical protein